MCIRACTWWAYGDWIKLFGPCWCSTQCPLTEYVNLCFSCDGSVTQVWHGALGMFSLWCAVVGWRPASDWENSDWLHGPDSYSFQLRESMGIFVCVHVHVCVCVSVCLYCMCMKLCKCTSPLFSTTEKALSCPGTGHAECHQLSKCMSMHMWIYVSECGICAFDETFWSCLLPKNTRISNRILYFCMKMQLQQLTGNAHFLDKPITNYKCNGYFKKQKLCFSD